MLYFYFVHVILAQLFVLFLSCERSFVLFCVFFHVWEMSLLWYVLFFIFLIFCLVLFFFFSTQGVYVEVEEREHYENKYYFKYDDCFEREEREKQGIILDIGAPAMTINDIGLKCFEKEVYGFEHDAPAGTLLIIIF